MALLSGVTCPAKLGGIFGLSCYLLLQGKIREMVPAENPNKETKIFMGHGDADQVVQYRWGKTTAERLKEWGWNVDFRTYPYVALLSVYHEQWGYWETSSNADMRDHLHTSIRSCVDELTISQGLAALG